MKSGWTVRGMAYGYRNLHSYQLKILQQRAGFFSTPHSSGSPDFFRVVAGRLALLMTGARKGKDGEPFWSVPIYTRVVEWGRAFRNACSYVQLNELEARGLMPHRPQVRARTHAHAHAPAPPRADLACRKGVEPRTACLNPVYSG